MTGPALSSRQRANLRRLAHDLDPSVTVGRQGATEAVEAAVGEALAARELVKVRLAGDRDERRAVADELAGRTAAAVVGTIGRIAILYRPAADPADRRIDPGP